MFFKDMKSQLGRDNFTIKIANNYDNMMWWTHLIIGFVDSKTKNIKHFALHINTQWSNKKMHETVIPYDFSSSLNENGKERPIRMTMKILDRWNKELFYKFIWNAIDSIKKNGKLEWENIFSALDNAGNVYNIEHIKNKIIEMLNDDLRSTW
jgi:hypothetical protein